MSWLRNIAKPTASEMALVKASATTSQPSKPPQRWQFDPDTAEWHYSTQVPSQMHPGTIGLSFASLMAMSRIPVIGTIIQTRISQVADFARSQPDPYSIGYRIRHRDVKREPTKRDENRIKEITELIERAGGPYWYGGFEGFLRAVTRDSLTYDQANFEVIRERGGRPWGFVPVDAATIRRAKPNAKAMATGRIDPDDIAFIQIMNNKVVNEWERHELAWCIRRPRTWVYANGYGFPELEELMTTITNLLNAETFNSTNFTNGIHTRTILGLKSTMDETMFKAFKREVVAMMSGVGNANRVPIIQLDPEFKEELAAVPLDRSNAEMEYREWLNWLLKIVCGSYGMDSAEINFVFGNEGQSTGGMQGSPVAERVALSKERGLRPLLRSIAYWLNEWVIQPFNEDYMIEFTGFDEQSEADRYELDNKAIRAWMTVDEIRAQKDLGPLPDGLGEIILDPTWYQAKQAADMAAQQEEQGGEQDSLFGPPGEEGEEDMEDMDFGGEDMDFGGEEEGEPMAASQGKIHYGTVDAVESLGDRLEAIYRKRLATYAEHMEDLSQ